MSGNLFFVVFSILWYRFKRNLEIKMKHKLKYYCRYHFQEIWENIKRRESVCLLVVYVTRKRKNLEPRNLNIDSLEMGACASQSFF